MRDKSISNYEEEKKTNASINHYGTSSTNYFSHDGPDGSTV